MPLQNNGGKSLTICAFVSIQYQSEKQTDGRICHNSIRFCTHSNSMLTRGKQNNEVMLPTDSKYYNQLDSGGAVW